MKQTFIQKFVSIIGTALVVGFVTAVAVFGPTSSAEARATFPKIFTETYKIPAGSALDKAKCKICHTDMGKKALNPYGVDLAKAMEVSRIEKLDAATLKKVESKDSDKDGVINIDEIKVGRLPGTKD